MDLQGILFQNEVEKSLVKTVTVHVVFVDHVQSFFGL